MMAEYALRTMFTVFENISIEYFFLICEKKREKIYRMRNAAKAEIFLYDWFHLSCKRFQWLWRHSRWTLANAIFYVSLFVCFQFIITHPQTHTMLINSLPLAQNDSFLNFNLLPTESKRIIILCLRFSTYMLIKWNQIDMGCEDDESRKQWGKKSDFNLL